MKIKMFGALCLFGFMIAILGITSVSAHTTVPAGPYDIEIGWVNEPPIIGQMNAIVVNISTASTTAGGASTPSSVDPSGLTVTVSYGGQSKVLTLRPLGEDTIGQYVAPMLPTIPGVYTVDVTGKLGTTDVHVEVQPEEVLTTDSVQFPRTAPTPSGGGFGLSGWLAVIGLACGLAGLILGVIALRRVR